MPVILGIVFIFFVSGYLYIQIFKRCFRILDEPSLTEKIFIYMVKKAKKRNKRILALKTAEKFIQPYEKIFSDLRLVNKYCVVELDSKNKSIKLRSKKFDRNDEKLSAVAYNFAMLDENDCFNHLCNIFGYKTTFDECIEITKEYSKIAIKVVEKKNTGEEEHRQEYQPEIRLIEPSKQDEKTNDSYNMIYSKNNSVYKALEPRIEFNFPSKIDINKSSESELIGLPGINIVLAKKIIKFREEQRQFYSVQDFLRTMKIKPHFAKQLEDLITISKINIQKVKKAKKERIIDI